MIDYFWQVFLECRNDEAIVWRGVSFSYKWLYEKIQQWTNLLNVKEIPASSIIILEADFSPNSVALFFALIKNKSIIVPLTSSVGSKRDEFIELAQGEYIIHVLDDDSVEFKVLPHNAHHPYYDLLRQRSHPGLILFSSGSTGKSKAAVHDLTGILEKFLIRRNKLRTIAFLLYDHIGGINTMLYILSNGGTLIVLDDRSPDSVLAAVERYKVQLLPTSPTFINLILLSEAYRRYDLGSLATVTYGTEPMPESTLKRFNKLFPQITLQQTYGLSEVGILRSKSKSSDSLWLKIGGEGYSTRVVDGVLQIKAKAAMIGYLNAPSPFTDEGWLNTGDKVEVEGDYFRFLGRESEIINVGGEKVYPAEVESVILMNEDVAEAIVYGEKNVITGQIVCAKVALKKFVKNQKEFVEHLRDQCKMHLQPYKIPVKFIIVSEKLYSDRFKKNRKPNE